MVAAAAAGTIAPAPLLFLLLLARMWIHVDGIHALDGKVCSGSTASRKTAKAEEIC